MTARSPSAMPSEMTWRAALTQSSTSTMPQPPFRRSRVGRRTGAAHDAVADGADLAEIRVGKIDRGELAGGDVEPCETVMPSLGIGADKLRRRQKGVGRLREIPLRLTEFSVTGTKR